MEMNTVITAIVVIVGIAITAALCFLYVRERTLEDIRADVYQAFLYAERYYGAGEGAKKMETVVALAHSMLPNWAAMFITDSVLRKIIQCWFDAVKDLLDDGKYNGSTKEEV